MWAVIGLIQAEERKATAQARTIAVVVDCTD